MLCIIVLPNRVFALLYCAVGVIPISSRLKETASRLLSSRLTNYFSSLSRLTDAY